MVLAASGVEHDQLVSVAEPLLSDFPSIPHQEEPKSVYTGGDYRCQADSGVRYIKFNHLSSYAAGLTLVFPCRTS